MGDMTSNENFNGFKGNCKGMGNTLTFYKPSDTSEEQQMNAKSNQKSEHLHPVRSNLKDVAACQSPDKNKTSCTHRCECILSLCDKPIENGLDSKNTEKLKEMQAYWVELHRYIRCIYKHAISSVTNLAVNDKVPKRLVDTVKALVEKLCEEDSQQLFIRVELLVRDFVLEAKDRLKDLQNSVDDVSVLYLKGLLTSYGAFCLAADYLAPCIPQLESLLMRRFSVNFQLLNKHIFQSCLYADVSVQNSVPLYISQLRANNEPDVEYVNHELIHSYLAFDDEMTDIASTWLDVKKLILKLSKKRILNNCQHPLLLEEWKLYRLHRELAASKMWQLRYYKQDMIEFDVQLLSLLDDITTHKCESKISSNPKTILSTCQSCNTDIICTCDDCTIKHILSCVETPPASPRHTPSDIISFLKLDFKNFDSIKLTNVETSVECTKDCEDISSIKFGKAKKKIYKTGSEADKFKKIQLSNKVMTFVASDEKGKDPEPPVIIPSSNVTTTTTESTPATATTAVATSKVPASSTSVAVNTTKSSLSQKIQAANAKFSEKNRLSKAVNKIVPNKGQCNHTTYQLLKKKNTKETSTLTEVCKEACADVNTINKNTAKESKRCDCPHCEVFENANGQAASKNNKTRERLRNRLNEKRNAVKETDTKSVDKNNIKLNEGVKQNKIEQPITIKKRVTDTRNIQDLVNFIEGKDPNAKLINSQKRLAKKARRLERKLEIEREKEAEKKRLEAQRLLEEQERLEQKRLEEARLKELEKQNKAKAKQNKKEKHAKNNKQKKNIPESPLVLPPKTCPENKRVQTSSGGPMVTIKRVMENNNSEPTVTITLKGSTPDKDKLLYTLVNGQTTKEKQIKETGSTNKKTNKKAKKEIQKPVTPPPIAPLSKKEKSKNKKKEVKQIQTPKAVKVTKSTNLVANQVKRNSFEHSPSGNSLHTESDFSLKMLKLPPGITITKVESSSMNKKSRINTKPSVQSSNSQAQSSDNRSGVIVVDTVKLKEVVPKVDKATTLQPSTNITNATNKKKKKKNKKNNNTNITLADDVHSTPYVYKVSSNIKSSNAGNSGSLVTIKNPMFYQLQESMNNNMSKSNMPDLSKDVRSQQASIIKGENGMVTIRSPRLNAVNRQNGHPEPMIPMHSGNGSYDLKPVIGPNTPLVKSPKVETNKPFNAQEILSGLPGIEITKINKYSQKTKNECKFFQPADVSIIPTNPESTSTNDNCYKLFGDSPDFCLETIFAPKKIKQGEVLDAEELELEAFKRFCQQSVPPVRKEKVIHLNVKDIVLKKKH